MTLSYQVGSVPGFGWVGRVRTPRVVAARIGEPRPRRTSAPLPQVVRDVLHDVAWTHGVSVDDILGDNRCRQFAHARQRVAFDLYAMQSPDGSRRFSMPQLGRYLNRDHTTILHAIRAHEKRMGGQG